MVREGLAAKRKRLCLLPPSLVTGTEKSRGVKTMEVSLHRVPRFLIDEIKLVYPDVFILSNAKKKMKEEVFRKGSGSTVKERSPAQSVLELSSAAAEVSSSSSSSSSSPSPSASSREEEEEEEERFLMAVPVFLLANFEIMERNEETEAERLRLWCAFQHFANVFKAMMGQRDALALSDYSDLDGSAATTRRTGTIYNEVQSCKALLGYRIRLCECVPIVSHPQLGWDKLVVHTVVAFCRQSDAQAVLGAMVEGYGRGGGGGGEGGGGESSSKAYLDSSSVGDGGSGGGGADGVGEAEKAAVFAAPVERMAAATGAATTAATTAAAVASIS